MISGIFHQILYRPLFNALIFLYNTVSFGDLGVAIIFLTIIIRVILFPLFHKSAKHQAVMQRLQPRIQQIQHDHKDDKEKQAQALLALYKENSINPLSGLFLIFLQLPVLWALFRVFYQGLVPQSFNELYAFVAAPHNLNANFLGLINLGKASIVLVVLSACAQYAQGKLGLPKSDGKGNDDPAMKAGKYMVLIGPLLTVVILSRLPAAISLYWLVSSLFSIGQQVFINKSLNHERPSL